MDRDILERHNFKAWIGVLPGTSWLTTHEHDLDGWQPTVVLTYPGVKYNMTIKDTSVIKEISKINRGAK